MYLSNQSALGEDDAVRQNNRILALPEKCRSAFVSLRSIFLQGGHIVTVGISRSSYHNICSGIENTSRDELRTNGIAEDVQTGHKEKSVFCEDNEKCSPLTDRILRPLIVVNSP